MREALEPIALHGGDAHADYELGIHYTARAPTRARAGSIAIVITPGGRRRVWRFMDRPSDRIDLARGRELV